MPVRGQRTPIAERFKKHIFRSKHSECLLWTGMSNREYGVIKTEAGKREKAHRVSFELFVRKLEPGECVLHKCDTPMCVEPTHLFAGTRGDNNRDRSVKGRNRNQHTGPLQKQ